MFNIIELVQRKDLILLQSPLMLLNTDLLRPPLIVPSMSAHFIFWLSSQQQQAAVVASTGTRLARENWWVILRAREHGSTRAGLPYYSIMVASLCPCFSQVLIPRQELAGAILSVKHVFVLDGSFMEYVFRRCFINSVVCLIMFFAHDYICKVINASGANEAGDEN